MIYPVVSTEIYSRLEKNIWTEKDYNQMGWHDCTIYAMAFKENDISHELYNQLIFDIDYIFEWVNPSANENFFTFWVAPCTLIFKNVWEVKTELELPGKDRAEFNLEISDLKWTNRTAPKNSDYQNWVIETHYNGKIEFASKGYVQIVRKLPMHKRGQQLNFEQRNGICFDLKPCLIP